jgi:hypothetical protein
MLLRVYAVRLSEQAKRRVSVLNYSFAFIKAEQRAPHTQMWYPVLINSNEANRRRHDKRVKTTSNWIKSVGYVH